MSNVEGSIKIINRAGTTLFESDDIGLKNSLGYYISHQDRITQALLAGSVSNYLWTPQEGSWIVTSVASTHGVVGGASAAVMPVVCSGSVAVASGTPQLVTALDLTLTAPRSQYGTLIATPTPMYRGDALALLFSGTLTNLVGSITVQIARVR